MKSCTAGFSREPAPDKYQRAGGVTARRQFVLPTDAQGCPACRQDLQLRAHGEQVCHELSNGAHEMLAVVEDQQQWRRCSATTRRSDSGWSPPPQSRVSGHGRDNEAWIIESSEIDEHGSVVKMRRDIGRDGQCQTRLAHTAGTGEGQKRDDLVEEEG